MGRAFAISILIALGAATAAAQNAAPKPYHDPRNTPLTYAGPGRHEAEPAALKEVRIAYFGPPDASDAVGGQMWQGTNLAVEEANREGGYRGLPFRLVPAWSGNPWSGGAATLAKAVFIEEAWAIIGGIDGATTHLAEQIVTKALLTLVNPIATDRSVHSASLPWMFSCLPGDQLQAPLISGELKRRGLPFALLSATDHDSRALVMQLKLAFTRDRLVPVLHLQWSGHATDAERFAASAVSSAAAVLVVAAGPGDTAVLVKAARQAGFRGAMISSPAIVRLAPDPSYAGVRYPRLGGIPGAFQAKFQARYGRYPDYTAAHAYDAAKILVAAVRKAGLNRVRIRDAVRSLSPFQGVTGTIEWDAVGQNQRRVVMETCCGTSVPHATLTDAILAKGETHASR